VSPVPATVRLVLAPRWWGWHLLLVVAVGAMGWLGWWQLQSFEDADRPDGDVTTRAVPLDRVTAPGDRLRPGDPGRQVTASGTWEAGGQVVQKLWPPLGTADFAPYISQLKRDVDAIYAQFSGADALRFGKQFAEAGLKERLPLIGGGTFVDEHVLRVQGDEVLGVITALHYSAALQTPANKKFAAAYEAKYKQIPSYYSEGTYVAGVALKAALEATGGDIENVDKFLAALRRVDLSESPRGPMRFDDYGNPIMNIYVRKVERVNGRLQNTVIHTFPMVSQFWTYRPEEFLKHPVYSRDYPPCKAC